MNAEYIFFWNPSSNYNQAGISFPKAHSDHTNSIFFVEHFQSHVCFFLVQKSLTSSSKCKLDVFGRKVILSKSSIGVLLPMSDEKYILFFDDLENRFELTSKTWMPNAENRIFISYAIENHEDIIIIKKTLCKGKERHVAPPCHESAARVAKRSKIDLDRLILVRNVKHDQNWLGIEFNFCKSIHSPKLVWIGFQKK